jgi:hypothetical protein
MTLQFLGAARTVTGSYDSAYLQERDAEYMSKKHAKKGEPPVEPLYTSSDVDQTIGQYVSIPYHCLILSTVHYVFRLRREAYNRIRFFNDVPRPFSPDFGTEIEPIPFSEKEKSWIRSGFFWLMIMRNFEESSANS